MKRMDFIFAGKGSFLRKTITEKLSAVSKEPGKEMLKNWITFPGSGRQALEWG